MTVLLLFGFGGFRISGLGVGGFGFRFWAGCHGHGTLGQDALQALKTGKVDISGNISIELNPGLTQQLLAFRSRYVETWLCQLRISACRVNN